MNYGYCRANTHSMLVDSKSKLGGIGFVVDVVSDFSKVSQSNLHNLLGKLQEGDTLNIVSIENAFADSSILLNVLKTLVDKGVELHSLLDNVKFRPTGDSVDTSKLLLTIAEFNINTEERKLHVSKGANRLDYPVNFLDVYYRYLDGEINGRRGASECFVSTPTFLKMVKNFDR